NPTSTVTLAHLIISRSPSLAPTVGQGGAIFDAAATLNLSNDLIGGSVAGADGTASTPAGDGQGGAIYQVGATPNLPGGSAGGGAAGGGFSVRAVPGREAPSTTLAAYSTLPSANSWDLQVVGAARPVAPRQAVPFMMRAVRPPSAAPCSALGGSAPVSLPAAV